MESKPGTLFAYRLILLLAAFLILSACGQKREEGARYADTPHVKKGEVTLVELGSLTCPPCQMMVPIIHQLTAEYSGRAAVVSINVHEDDTAARKFAVMVIPTQIIYDRTGKEVFRHVGFIEKEPLQQELNKLL